jgi:hypothetical protein
MTEIFAPMLQVLSMTLTKDPKHLVVADNVSLEDAPFRITFLGTCLDCWESSSIERLDLLTPAIRHSPLRGHEWMLTLQGCQPMPKPRGEEKILPRLKLSSKPPNFDFSKIRQNLIDNSDDEARISLLRGLHEKLWHELYAGMERFLQRLGVPDRCYKLIEIVIATCTHCNAFKPVPRRPRFGVELSGHFGDCLMIDLFYIFGMQFLMMIDEAVRYKVVCLCTTKDAKTLAKVMLLNWFRYFGPPKVLRSDQEGGIRSEEFAQVCDRFSIHRQLAGSDDTGQHTQTGLPEKHIQLVKLSSLKCQHQCEAQGLNIDKEDIVVECAM